MNLKPRGPDVTSFQIIKNLSVGFHRLAIMDLAFHANQPYILEDGDRTIVFVCNGEIYDFKELIAKYDLPIHNNSDCMTIPQLYLKLVKHNETSANNIESFVKLFSHEIKGEFVFVLSEFNKDRTLKQVIVGRDMVGVRPLYVGYEKSEDLIDTMMFSSEIKGMLNYKGHVSEFEPGTILHYHFTETNHIDYTKVHDFSTIYDVVPEDLAFTNPNQAVSADYPPAKEFDFLQNVRESIVASVKRRLEADVEIGFLLSGGLDSSLVAAISAKLLNRPIKTFCCGILGTESTDIRYAKTVADHIKSQHTEVLFTIEEALAIIPQVIRTIESYDVTSVRASVGQYMVSKYIATNTNIRVILTGEGADEVASGYLYNYYAPSGDALHLGAKEYVKDVHKYDGRRVDRCVSGVSCEARIALLDPEFISAYWAIPSEWRMPTYKGCEKWWMRKAFDGTDVLNSSVLWRKKEAFSDGISGTAKSWYQIIQEHIDTLISDKEFAANKKTCVTKEQYYYQKIFCEIYGEARLNIITHMWMPKWDDKGNKITGYVDPSARTLSAYTKTDQ
jgi:asparagine synthase (glutamine-hydrolysing)